MSEASLFARLRRRSKQRRDLKVQRSEKEAVALYRKGQQLPSLSRVDYSQIENLLDTGEAEFRDGELVCTSYGTDCGQCGNGNALGTPEGAFHAGPIPDPVFRIRKLQFRPHENGMDVVADSCLGTYVIMPDANYLLRLQSDGWQVKFSGGRGEGSYEAAVATAQAHLEATLAGDLIQVAD